MFCVRRDSNYHSTEEHFNSKKAFVLGKATEKPRFGNWYKTHAANTKMLKNSAKKLQI